MKIHNVRLGLATNSSSTHSIVILNNGYRANDNFDHDHFGWEDFVLANKDSKSLYLANTLYLALENAVGPDIAKTVASQWADAKDIDEFGGIDHQSVICLPLDWDEKAIDKAFFDDFYKFIMRDDVAILGGNDNSDGHWMHKSNDVKNTNHFGLPLESSNKGFVCKNSGDHWVLFNRENGTKIRISFNQPEDFVPTKAFSPELVDVKITDYCPFGCEYCYQDSTPHGEHASLEAIKNIASAFATMRVFEVALGGGEPTMHPDFVEILKTFRQHKIVPNFTTKSVHWLKDDKLREDILKYAGSFAYSVENAKEAEEIIDLCEKYEVNARGSWWASSRLVLHYVMGVGTAQDFQDVLKTAKENWIEVTLLGYKTNGRGSLFDPKNNGNWVDYVMDLHKNNECPTLGIDTKLAQDSLPALKKAGIPDSLYHVEEGKFSMYLDAVNSMIGPSSYCDKNDMKFLKLGRWGNKETLLKHFESF